MVTFSRDALAERVGQQIRTGDKGDEGEIREMGLQNAKCKLQSEN